MLVPQQKYRVLVPLVGLALLMVLGCHQGHLQPSVLGVDSATHATMLPAATDREVTPVMGGPHRGEPGFSIGKSTVVSPELPKRPVSLSECIALALENGRTGAFFDGPGSTQRSSVTGFTDNRTPSGASDSIRVFALDPAIVATNIEESLARFDVWGETSTFWNRIDQRSRYLTPLTGSNEVLNRNKVDDVDFSAGLYRRLPTGGFAGLRMRTGYEDNFLGPIDRATTVNPTYRPIFDMMFEQPLLQGAGVFINQLRDFHPGSIRQTLPDSGKPPGILLARISHRQQQLDFERQVHELVYRVEEAYWQLYCAYWDYYSSDNGMKQAHAAWQIAKARSDAGGLAIEDLAMVEEQYHFFRHQRLQSLGRGQPGRPGILEAERRLRYVVGLPSDDGSRLIPLDAPDFLAYEPDLTQSVVDAHSHRPELRQVEEEIRAAHLNVDKAKDRLKPDLRFVGRYGLNGLGDDLGQGFNDLGKNPHHEWEIGLRLQYALGARAGNAEAQRADLQLTQRLIFLKDQREKLLFSLQRSHQELVQYREQYKVRIKQREAAALQLKARSEKFKAGGDPKLPGSFIDLLLRAQRNWADAVREEYVALCSYRIAITEFELQKGTILKYANVAIADGPLPTQVRPHASEYLRKRYPARTKVATQVPADHEPALVVADSFPMPITNSGDTNDKPSAPRLPLSLPASDQSGPRPPVLGAPSFPQRPSFGEPAAPP